MVSASELGDADGAPARSAYIVDSLNGVSQGRRTAIAWMNEWATYLWGLRTVTSECSMPVITQEQHPLPLSRLVIDRCEILIWDVSRGSRNAIPSKYNYLVAITCGVTNGKYPVAYRTRTQVMQYHVGRDGKDACVVR